MAFHESPAFELLYGGAAGGGKTWSLLAEGARQSPNPHYNGILFRRTSPQLKQADGPIFKSREMYSGFGSYGESGKVWSFDAGGKFYFGHMAERYDYLTYDGSAFAYIAFDELAHFYEDQYRYMFSRARVPSDSGLRTYVRAATNPPGRNHPGKAWIKKRWAPWLDKSHPNPAAQGEIRWYAIIDGVETEVAEGTKNAWSRSFIQAFYTDNPSLDKTYERNLDSLPIADRKRLKMGIWDIDDQEGAVFDKRWFRVEPHMPQGEGMVRFWDFAATEKKSSGDDPDFTATTLMFQRDGLTYFQTMRDRLTPAGVKLWMRELMEREPGVRVGWEQEGGSSGVFVRDDLMELCRRMGRSGRAFKPQGDKVQRASLWSPFAEQGKIILVSNHHTPIEAIIDELHNFPNGPHDDMIDSMSGAWRMTASEATVQEASWGY